MEEDLEDIASLYWYIIPKKHQGKKLPPVFNVWEFDHCLVVACLPPNDQKWVPLERQLKSNITEEELLCPFPDYAFMDIFKTEFKKLKKSLPVNQFCFPFYTFDEYFKKLSEVENVVLTPGEKAVEYARYLRKLRTEIMLARGLGLEIILKIGNVDQMKAEINRREMDVNDPASWPAVMPVLDDMPEVIVTEERHGIKGVVTSPVYVSFSHIGHWGNAGTVDCIGAVIHTKETVLNEIRIWLNPVKPFDDAMNRATDIILERANQYNASEIIGIEGILPFEVCNCCGKQTLRVPDMIFKGQSEIRKQSSGKIGRNEPCPCGSGKKYEKCCGKEK